MNNILIKFSFFRLLLLMSSIALLPVRANSNHLSSLCSRIKSSLQDSIQILYFQENAITPVATTTYQNTISDLCSDCTEVNQYAISVWIQKKSFGSGKYDMFFRVSNNPT